jgi:hypothetical protein
MSTRIALLLLEGGLLLIAILGGGFEIRELRIPKVERLPPRILAGIGGLLFVILGMSVGAASDSRSEKEGLPRLLAHDQPKSQESPRIRFVIFDELEPHHIASDHREQAAIRIDGIPVGTLTVNEYFPKSELIVHVANEGQHSFAIEATAIFRINNTLAEVNCFGTGTIDVATDSRFLFESRYDPRGGPCLAWLEKR